MNTAAKLEVGRKSRARKTAAPAVSPEDRALADKLLSAPTIADKSWAPARGYTRNEGESRSEFIHRVLLGEVAKKAS